MSFDIQKKIHPEKNKVDLIELMSNVYCNSIILKHYGTKDN